MPRYRLLRGIHVHGQNTYSPGAVIDTAQNLLRLNAPGSIRFERVYEEEEPTPVETTPEPTEEEPTDDLEALTLAELRDLAEAEEVDLGDAKRKADVLEVLRRALT